MGSTLYRLVLMSGVWYALEIDEIDQDEIENLKEFLLSGDTVIYTDDLAGIRDELMVDIKLVE